MAAARAFFTRDVFYDGASIGGAFDIILAIGLLHHLDDQQTAALLGAARRRLKPGGRMVSHRPGANRSAALDRASHHSQQTAASMFGQRLNTSALQGLSSARYEWSWRTDLLRLPYTHVIMQCSA